MWNKTEKLILLIHDLKNFSKRSRLLTQFISSYDKKNQLILNETNILKNIKCSLFIPWGVCIKLFKVQMKERYFYRQFEQ